MKRTLVFGMVSAILAIAISAQAGEHESLTCPLSVHYFPYGGNHFGDLGDSQELDQALAELGYKRDSHSRVIIDTTQHSVDTGAIFDSYTVVARLLPATNDPVAVSENTDHHLAHNIGPYLSYDRAIGNAAVGAVKRLPKCSELIDQINLNLNKAPAVSQKRKKDVEEEVLDSVKENFDRALAAARADSAR